MAVSQDKSMELDKDQYCQIIWIVLTWLSSDDANLSELKSKIEPIVSHHQIVVQLAPVLIRPFIKDIISKDDRIAFKW